MHTGKILAIKVFIPEEKSRKRPGALKYYPSMETQLVAVPTHNTEMRQGEMNIWRSESKDKKLMCRGDGGAGK